MRIVKIALLVAGFAALQAPLYAADKTNAADKTGAPVTDAYQNEGHFSGEIRKVVVELR